MSLPRVLKRVTQALDQAGIAYMLSGSIASAFYGTPRSTQDVDIVIAPTREHLSTLVGLLPATEYYADQNMALDAVQAASMFNVIDLDSSYLDKWISELALTKEWDDARRIAELP